MVIPIIMATTKIRVQICLKTGLFSFHYNILAAFTEIKIKNIIQNGNTLPQHHCHSFDFMVHTLVYILPVYA
jgi:hypothetical protein